MKDLARRFRRATCTVVSCAIVAIPLPALAGEQTIRCDSGNYRYRYCRIDTDNRAELIDRHSMADCSQGRSWGYDSRGVWVDKGCSATFRVGRDRGGNKAAVAGAVVGLALLAAIASSKQKSESAEIAGWAVGNFSGYDEREGTNVELSILPGGSVSGRAGSQEFRGSLQGQRLEAGRQLFRIERQGNGFLAIDERDGNHRVVFQRGASGY